jgi:hypothetical protein
VRKPAYLVIGMSKLNAALLELVLSHAVPSYLGAGYKCTPHLTSVPQAWTTIKPPPAIMDGEALI